jgi:hypothetical protein
MQRNTGKRQQNAAEMEMIQYNDRDMSIECHKITQKERRKWEYFAADNNNLWPKPFKYKLY